MMAARLYHVLLLCGLALHAHSAGVAPGDSEDEVLSDQLVSIETITAGCPAKCSCTGDSFSATLKVDCGSYTGEQLPEKLPTLKNGSSYELLFADSHLKSITYRPYLKNTTKAIFSHSRITEISADAWHAWACDVKDLRLDGNKLQRLPHGFEEEEFHSLADLRLSGNPWACDCKALDLRQFLLVFGHVITDKNDVTCHSPSYVANRKIVDVGTEKFCNEPEVNITPYLIGIGVVIFIIVVVAVIFLFLRRMRS